MKRDATAVTRPARFRPLVVKTVIVLAGSTLSACATFGNSGTACAGTPATGPGGQAISMPGPASSIITLVTGDRVGLDVAPDGTQSVAPMLPAAGAGSSSGFLRVDWAGDRFLVPDAAVPYLGSTLDPRLFDISYLAAAKLDDAHSKTLPIQIDAPGSAAKSLPGIHLTHTSGITSTGTVAKSEAAKFGRLLMRQWRDSRTGSAAAPTGLLPRIGRISLIPPDGTTLPAALPQAGLQLAGHAGTSRGLHYHTVRFNFVGLDGQPAVAAGWVQNVDDARLSTFTLNSGTTQVPPSLPVPPGRLSLPEGTYSMVFGVLTPHPGAYMAADSAVVVDPEIKIDSDRTITFDARTAKPYRATLDAPVTATVREDAVSVSRSSATGGCTGGHPAALGLGAVSMDGDGSVGSSLAVTPTSPVKKGALNFDAISDVRTSEPGVPAPSDAPHYALDFPHAGTIPDNLTYRVATADLTTVHENVYQHLSDTTSPRLLQRIYHPWHDVVPLSLDEALEIVSPGARTDYRYTSDSALTLWQDQFDSGSDPPAFLLGARRSSAPGQQITETWGKGPSVPSAAARPLAVPVAGGAFLTAAPQVTVAPAVRQDDNATLYLAPGGDSTSSHYLDAYEALVRFYRNGQLAVTSASEPTGGKLSIAPMTLPLLPDPATYRLNIATSSPVDKVATTDTDWTFPSSRHDPKKAPPKTELCGPDPSRTCSFLPLLFVTYDLQLNQRSQAQAGAPFTISFTVAHQQAAPGPVGVSATVAVSYDDGKTWSDPQTAISDGNAFTTTIQHPPLADTSGFVALRINARDTGGASVEQTIIHAYGLTD